MFRRMRRPISISAGRARSGRDIRYGGQIWAFAVLVAVLAALTSPLWLFFPSEAFGTKNQFRMAGASFWIALLAMALMAGRSWGLRLILNHTDRSVSRESAGPWKTKILWTWSGERIDSVSLTTDSLGVSWLHAAPKEGKPFLIEKGVRREDLGVLGEEIAQCWGVPFKS